MHASTLLSLAAAALLAGVARAEIEFRFYEGLECKDGAEAVTMKFQHANTVVFEKPIYRTVLVFQRVGAPCSWKAHHDWNTARDRDVAVGRRRRDAVYANCVTQFNQQGQSLAFHSIEVLDC